MNIALLRNQVRMVLPPEITDVSESNLDTLINQGLLEISTQFTWPWLEETATVSLTADTRTVAVPADYLYGAVLVDDDRDQELPYIAALEFFRRVGNDTGNTTTSPDFYTIREGLIYFSPIPSTTDTNRYTFYYYKKPTTMSGSDSPPFNEAFHYILVEYSKWKLYEREGLFEQAQVARASYMSYLSDMRAWYGRAVQRAPFLWGGGSHSYIYARDRNIPSLNVGF